MADSPAVHGLRGPDYALTSRPAPGARPGLAIEKRCNPRGGETVYQASHLRKLRVGTMILCQYMKKLMLILAVAAFAFSPLMVSPAEAGQGKHAHAKHHTKHHHGKHHPKN